MTGAHSDTEAQNSSDGADGTGPAKRKRGRPRKYEDLTEEERKQRRAVDNRHAAKRSYYRRINKMTELEQVRHAGCDRRSVCASMPIGIERRLHLQENAALKQELQTALGKLAAYEAGAGVAGINVRQSASVSMHWYVVDLITSLLQRSPRLRR